MSQSFFSNSFNTSNAFNTSGRHSPVAKKGTFAKPMANVSLSIPSSNRKALGKVTNVAQQNLSFQANVSLKGTILDDDLIKENLKPEESKKTNQIEEQAAKVKEPTVEAPSSVMGEEDEIENMIPYNPALDEIRYEPCTWGLYLLDDRTANEMEFDEDFSESLQNKAYDLSDFM